MILKAKSIKGYANIKPITIIEMVDFITPTTVQKEIREFILAKDKPKKFFFTVENEDEKIYCQPMTTAQD